MQKDQPPQSQPIPGSEKEMVPQPQSKSPNRKSDRFQDKVVIVTGGDSGIGKATAIAFAEEGAKVGIIYHTSDDDANTTKEEIEKLGAECVLLKGDVGDKKFCTQAVTDIANTLGGVNILINNAGEQHPQENILDITEEQLTKTFRTNIFSMFYMTQAVLPFLKKGDSIINTASITAYRGHEILIDYSSTKGAIVSFTRALAQNLASKGIRVNAVAPGPIWTPLIPSTFPPEQVAKFGTDTPIGRPGQPYEVACGFTFLASDDASYITGQTIHINGGHTING